MKKMLFTVGLFLGLALSLYGAPLLVEAYQKGPLSIPIDNTDTLTIAEVAFTIDTNCYVQFATSGNVMHGLVWINLDGKSLPPVLRLAGSTTGGIEEPGNIVYNYLLNTGPHTVTFCLGNYTNTSSPTTISNAYLQALIFLPDSASAVAEQPAVEPGSPVTNAVISRGPYVSAPGASMVVDASGRVMENVLVDSKVSISSLPAGTYYAKDKERTVVKIVKVD